MDMTIDKKELQISLYQTLYLIRRSEEKIIEYYNEDEMKTPMHMSMGAEAISAGICAAMQPFDQVFGTYRSHALYLAKTHNTDDFFAEMYGKDVSPLKGKGGSMHLCAAQQGFMGTSAIVSSAIPVAVGCSFANKQQQNNKITAVFFGDGAIEEGAFFESINVASMMKLPVLFVCEDNGLAVHTFQTERRGYSSIADIVSQFNCIVLKEDTTDVEKIYDLTKKAIALMKEKQMPCFIQLSYYRYLEHVGVNKDFDACYRSEDDFNVCYKHDPIIVQRKKIIAMGVSEEEIINKEAVIDKQVEASLQAAKKAPFADISEIYKGVLQ
jgi:TPP-dependent pyruvate/acetoin dehydrogenase alpha subunit